MRKVNVIHAVDDAKRFIMRAEELIKAEGNTSGNYYYNSPREQGFVKRASMDLTRALADLRRRQS